MNNKHHFLIIGNGRMAKHMLAYCHYLNLSANHWKRDDGTPTLNLFIKQASHIFLLINDNQINSFILEHRLNQQNKKMLIHFSGALTTPYSESAHPLMTFGPEIYDLKTYQSILFVCEQNRATFNDMLPGFPNKHVYIQSEKKAYYHCLGALANNFTTILWQNYFTELKTQFNIDHKDVLPIVEQTFKNIKQDYKTALTGPLKRGDKNTIQKHLIELHGTPFENIYKSFMELYESNKDKII